LVQAGLLADAVKGRIRLRAICHHDLTLAGKPWTHQVKDCLDQAGMGDDMSPLRAVLCIMAQEVGFEHHPVARVDQTAEDVSLGRLQPAKNLLDKFSNPCRFIKRFQVLTPGFPVGQTSTSNQCKVRAGVSMFRHGWKHAGSRSRLFRGEAVLQGSPVFWMQPGHPMPQAGGRLGAVRREQSVRLRQGPPGSSR